MIQLDPIQVVLLTMMIACLFLTLGMLIGRMIYMEPKPIQVSRVPNYLKDKTESTSSEVTHEVEYTAGANYDTFFLFSIMDICCKTSKMKNGDRVKVCEITQFSTKRTGRYMVFTVKSSDHPYYQVQKVATVN